MNTALANTRPHSHDIVLSTLNSRYLHSAFGLRYLYASLGEFQSRATIREFTIHQRPADIAEQLLAEQPRIIGFSVYIWNIAETTEVVAFIKTLAPDVVIVLGGPEVSHTPDLPEVCSQADYVIAGPGEKSFPELVTHLLNGEPPSSNYIEGEHVSPDKLALPYRFYDDDDIRNRLIYVEASRGCPFKCEFCLSSLDKTATAFPLDQFLAEIDTLWQRGVRNFKFIDRTFNLKVSTSVAILEFFLARMSDDLYVHFEVIPDNLPDRLKSILQRFPADSLQFEIGVQTFDPIIQERISRRQNNEKTIDNIRWLREHTGAHLHTDLIFGLPGDTLENFADSFNQLVELKPQEIQLGILKRLRGAPLNRHNQTYDLRYNPQAPYNIIHSREIDFQTLQRVNRMARFWDLIANSGRFPHTLPLILGDDAFRRFLRLSDRLYQVGGRTWKIALKRLFEMLYLELTETFEIDASEVSKALLADHQHSGLKSKPDFEQLPQLKKRTRTGKANKRQRMHA